MERKNILKKIITEINYEFLKPSPLNTYKVNELDDLVGSIKTTGLLTPLTVMGPDEDGLYTILSGERRFTAIGKIKEEGFASYETIPCYIIGKNLPELEQKLIIETSNLETRDFDKDEHRFHVINILNEMVENGDMEYEDMIKEAQSYMSVSERYVRMYKRINDSSEDSLKKLLIEHEISVQEASRMSGWDAEDQKNAVERIRTAKEKAEKVAKNDREIRQAVNKEKKDIFDAHKKSPITEEIAITSEHKDSSAPVKYDDSAFIDRVISGDFDNNLFDDISDDDLFNSFDRSSDIDVPLDIDTAGEIKKLKDDDERDYKKFLNSMISWAKRKAKKPEFTEDEQEVLDAFEVLFN